MSTNTNTTTKKMTYAAALTTVINGDPITPEVKERLVALANSLDKKAASKKPTEQQKKNADFKTAILAWLNLHPGEKFTITQLCKSVPELAENPEATSSQRVSAIVRQMVKEDCTVVRTEEKRVAYFSLPSNSEEASDEVEEITE